MPKKRPRTTRTEPMISYDPQKKLAEAKYFLGRLQNLDRDSKLDCGGEEFDYNLSAFGAAARTVIAALPKATKGRIDEERWRSELTPEECQLWDGLVEFRDAEIHDGRSDRETIDEQEPAMHHLMRNAGERSAKSFAMSAFGDGEAVITVRRRLSPARGPRIPAVDWCQMIVSLIERKLQEFRNQGLL